MMRELCPSRQACPVSVCHSCDVCVHKNLSSDASNPNGWGRTLWSTMCNHFVHVHAVARFIRSPIAHCTLLLLAYNTCTINHCFQLSLPCHTACAYPWYCIARCMSIHCVVWHYVAWLHTVSDAIPLWSRHFVNLCKLMCPSYCMLCPPRASWYF